MVEIRNAYKIVVWKLEGGEVPVGKTKVPALK
jgi:hypothetical protein